MPQLGLRGLKELPSEVRALVGVAFMVALGFGLVAAGDPAVRAPVRRGKTAAGAVISAFALMRLLAAPFVGRLVNAAGERVVLATGIGVVAVSSALSGLAQDYWQLLVLRGAGGVGSIMFSVSAASLLIRVTPSHQRGRAQGVWAGSFLIGSDRRSGRRHGRQLLAAPAVLPLRRDAGRRRRARAGQSAPQRAGGPAGRRAPRSCRWPPRCATAPTSPRWSPRSPATSPWSVARVSIVPQFITDRLGLGSGWVYAAFLVVSVVSGALLLPFGHIADTRGRRR